jgi:LPS-assembly protein
MAARHDGGPFGCGTFASPAGRIKAFFTLSQRDKQLTAYVPLTNLSSKVTIASMLKRQWLACTCALWVCAASAVAQDAAPLSPVTVSASLPSIPHIDNLAKSLPVAGGESKPFDMKADNIMYDGPTQTMTAVGNVMVSNTQATLTADTIQYHTSDSTVSAYGNVVLTDPTSQTLKVDELTISSNLTTGSASALRVGVPDLGDIAHADKATLTETDKGRVLVMDNVLYSPCRECEGPKPWDIQAEKVTYNQSEGSMTYRNASMQVRGNTIMVLPWFRHPVGPQKPTNGILPTMFGRSTTLGEQITLSGYYFNPAENADYTLRNRLMSERGDLISLERRQITLSNGSELKLSYLNDRETGKVRSNAYLEAQHDFSAGRRIGINGEVASDDTYLQQFYHRLDPYLASTVYGEDADDQHYYALSATHYQDLDITHSPGATAQVTPHLQLERWISLLGGQATLTGDMMNVTRDEGTESRRMVGQAAYERPFMLPDGSKVTMGGQMRADLYNINGAGTSNAAVTRLLPQASVDWEKPYISPNGTHTIAPRVMGIWSPKGGNSNNKVPNEDSEAYELETANLFQSNRFAGMDRVETGPRLIYGLDNRWGTPDHTAWRAFFGQSLRTSTDSSLPSSGGASTVASDWVAQLEAEPSQYLKFASGFRLDNATFIPRRVDTSVRIGRDEDDDDNEGPRLEITHSYLQDTSHELDAELVQPLSPNWDLKANARHDLLNSKWLQAEGALIWKRDCYAIEFLTRRRGYTNSDVRPSTDYLINLQLLTLGTPNRSRLGSLDE